MKTPSTKVIVFILMILLLGLLSYAGRNFLIANYDGCNFSLVTIDYVKNTGAAFSLFSKHTIALILLSITILAILLYMIFYNIKKITYPNLLLYALMLAGVFCNLFERIFDGFVTDYIKLNFVTFPIFNISDIFINIGAFFVICNILFNNDYKKDR